MRAVARAIEAHYRSISSLKAVFFETYREGRGNVRAESGTVYFHRPGQMRWEYEAPEQKLFLVDGKYAWFYVPADHTASRASVKKSEDWRTPFALLTGRANLQRLCGRMEVLTGSEGAGGGSKDRASEPGNVLLRCWPRERDASGPNTSEEHRSSTSSFREVLIEANGGYSLVRVVIRQAGDLETEIRFGNWQENVPLPATIFRFNPPMGVAIVDEASLGDWSQ